MKVHRTLPIHNGMAPDITLYIFLFTVTFAHCGTHSALKNIGEVYTGILMMDKEMENILTVITKVNLKTNETDGKKVLIWKTGQVYTIEVRGGDLKLLIKGERRWSTITSILFQGNILKLDTNDYLLLW